MYFNKNNLYCNTYQSSHGVLARIGTDFRGRVWISWYCPLHTGGIHANTSEYIPNLLMTGTKPVIVEGFVLVCICMYWCLYWYVLCLYWHVLVCIETRQRAQVLSPRSVYVLHVLACISMYWYVLCMYYVCNPNFNTNQSKL